VANATTLTLSLRIDADGKVAVDNLNQVEQAVTRMEQGVKTATGSMGMTWKQFTAERMSEYMRLEGGHAGAMRRMGEEWQALKNSGVAASQGVAVAAQSASQTAANHWRQLSGSAGASISVMQSSHAVAVRSMAADQGAYKAAGISAAAEVAAASEKSTGVIAGGLASVKSAIMGVVAGFTLWKLTTFTSDAALFAANVETMTIAMNVVGNATGHTAAEMRKFRDEIKQVGITTETATKTVAQMARAGLDLEKGVDLAKIAQGAKLFTPYVKSSSEALEMMITSIVTGNTAMLHNLGIAVAQRDMLRENKLATGESAMAVDSHRRHQMLLNEVLDKGNVLLNVNAAAMETAGKQIASSRRPIEELKLALGELFLPELTIGAKMFYTEISNLVKLVRDPANVAGINSLKTAVALLIDTIILASKITAAYLLIMVGIPLLATKAGLAIKFFTDALAVGAATQAVTTVGLMGETIVVTAAQAATATPIMRIWNAAVGTEAVTAAFSAASALGKFKMAGQVVMAFFAGWELGKYLYDQFEIVRVASVNTVWPMIKAWKELGFAVQEAMAHMDPTTSHEQTKEIIADIHRERDEWRKFYAEGKAEALAEATKKAAGAKPYQDNQAAIAAGLAAERERLRKEQELRDSEAAKTAEKERKRQAEISQVLAAIRERDLLIGKEKDDKELIQLDLKHLKELNSLKAHKANQEQLDEAHRLQKKERDDLFDNMAIERAYDIASTEAKIAEKNFQDKAAWLDKLDQYKLKTGKITETEALQNQYDRQRAGLELQQQGLEIDIEHEKDLVKRNALEAEYWRLGEQVVRTKEEQANAVSLLLAKEQQAAFDHQQKLQEINANGLEARLQFLGREQEALTAHYAFKEQALNASFLNDMQRENLSYEERLARVRQFEADKFQTQQEYAQRQAEVWWNGAQAYMGFTQQMMTFGVQMALADESQRGQIGKRMLATSVRFLAQGLQQYMFHKAQEHLLNAASAAGRVTTDTAAAISNLGLLEIQATAWAAFLTALAMNPFGGEVVIPAAAAMTAVAGGVVPGSMAAAAATGAGSIAAELGMAAAWGIGGMVVGGIGEGVASSIEGGASGTPGNPIATTPGTAAAASSPTSTAAKAVPPVINIHIYGNVVDHDKFAAELIPALKKAVGDGVH
jgi:hypothetical protein